MAAHDQREVSSEDESSTAGDLRRGPWTVEEDLLLVNYIAAHGEGRWNALARCAGLKRTGKSCRLRWLNYLRPDIRRGNITAQEQLLILELHSRWGNRWSKIAQHLPGRTDNEIKNYWRTRVQKHARQLNCDVNSQQFKDLMRYLWMPRLLERINSDAVSPPPPACWPLDDVADYSACTTAASSSSVSTDDGMQMQRKHQQNHLAVSSTTSSPPPLVAADSGFLGTHDGPGPLCSSSTFDAQALPHTTEYPAAAQLGGAEACSWSSAGEPLVPGLADVYADMALPDLGDTMWGVDDLWYTQLMGL